MIKRVLSGLLRRMIGSWAYLARAIRRLLAHARLAAKVGHRLPASLVVEGPPEVHGTARIAVGAGGYLYPGLYLETRERGRIDIGERVVMSRGVHLVAYERIEIGDGVMIGEYASLRDANHDYRTSGDLRDAPHTAAGICIEPNAWIGRGAVILPGVTVGERAVVGANAVVTRDVPACTVAVGVPAAVRKLVL